MRLHDNAKYLHHTSIKRRLEKSMNCADFNQIKKSNSAFKNFKISLQILYKTMLRENICCIEAPSRVLRLLHEHGSMVKYSEGGI